LPTDIIDHTFLSYDAPVSTGPKDALAVHVAEYNLENLNKKSPTGLPLHKLRVKVSGIYMIVKNLDNGGGLSNGTRLQVLEDFT
jgi:DNA helicase Pif1-like protein